MNNYLLFSILAVVGLAVATPAGAIFGTKYDVISFAEALLCTVSKLEYDPHSRFARLAAIWLADSTCSPYSALAFLGEYEIAVGESPTNELGEMQRMCLVRIYLHQLKTVSPSRFTRAFYKSTKPNILCPVGQEVSIDAVVEMINKSQHENSISI